MLLQLSAQFDPRRDVAPWLSQQAAGDLNADTLGNNFETLHIVNVERNGNVLYTWKGNQGHTFIGLFDPRNQQNQHIYTFEKDLHVISCSVNLEKTLLAVTFLQPRKEERINLLFQPVSKCLTLLVEIHPVNNEKVLKAVDSCIKVQFLYPAAETSTFPESCLLLFSEDKYIEKFDIKVVREGHRVVIENSNQLKRERIADDFIWVQWDMLEQRLFYIVPKESGDTLNCIQFYPDKNFKLILEAPLEISLDDIGLKCVLRVSTYFCLEVFKIVTNNFVCFICCYMYPLAPKQLQKVLAIFNFQPSPFNTSEG